MNTYTLSAKNVIEISSVVSEILPGKVKSRGTGHVYLVTCIYLAKYGQFHKAFSHTTKFQARIFQHRHTDSTMAM